MSGQLQPLLLKHLSKLDKESLLKTALFPPGPASSKQGVFFIMYFLEKLERMVLLPNLIIRKFSYTAYVSFSSSQLLALSFCLIYRPDSNPVESEIKFSVSFDSESVVLRQSCRPSLRPQLTRLSLQYMY